MSFDATDPALLAEFFRHLPTSIDHVMVTEGGQPYYAGCSWISPSPDAPWRGLWYAKQARRMWICNRGIVGKSVGDNASLATERFIRTDTRESYRHTQMKAKGVSSHIPFIMQHYTGYIIKIEILV
jgi:hypothetical protein